MTKTQGITAGVCGVTGLVIFILAITLSLPRTHDDTAIWRTAAFVLVIICAMGMLAAIIIARIERSRVVVYADRRSLEPFLPRQELPPPQYDTTDIKRRRAYAYVDQQAKRILRRPDRRRI